VTLNKEDAWRFLVIWEFLVRPGKEQLFEQTYGPDGDWVQLFTQSIGYCGTKLMRDDSESQRYLTLDFWKSEQDYERFKSHHSDEYKAIDTKCEALTEEEREIGKFVLPRASN
jgi:heme-degrading monooxygenase HmoA